MGTCYARTSVLRDSSIDSTVSEIQGLSYAEIRSDKYPLMMFLKYTEVLYQRFLYHVPVSWERIEYFQGHSQSHPVF